MEYIFYNMYFYFRLSGGRSFWFDLKVSWRLKNEESKSSQDQDPFEGITIIIFSQLF